MPSGSIATVFRFHEMHKHTLLRNHPLTSDPVLRSPSPLTDSEDEQELRSVNPSGSLSNLDVSASQNCIVIPSGFAMSSPMNKRRPYPISRSMNPDECPRTIWTEEQRMHAASAPEVQTVNDLRLQVSTI